MNSYQKNGVQYRQYYYDFVDKTKMVFLSIFIFDTQYSILILILMCCVKFNNIAVCISDCIDILLYFSIFLFTINSCVLKLNHILINMKYYFFGAQFFFNTYIKNLCHIISSNIHI